MDHHVSTGTAGHAVDTARQSNTWILKPMLLSLSLLAGLTLYVIPGIDKPGFSLPEYAIDARKYVSNYTLNKTIYITDARCSLKTYTNYPHNINIPCDHLTNWRIPMTHQHFEIVLEGKGRLGNILTEYAGLWGIAKLLNRDPVFIIGKYQGRVLSPLELLTNLSMTFRTRGQLNAKARLMEPSIWYLENTTLEMSFVEQIARHRKSVEIGDYLTSWRYFLPHAEEDIRREFTFRPELVQSATAYRNKLLQELWQRNGNRSVGDKQDVNVNSNNILNSKNITFVGIHCRRGDKVKRKDYRLPNETYFTKAKRYFKEKYANVIFVVTGEDYSYLNRTFQSEDTIISTGQSAVFDMVLQGLCHHTITSQGTFSWWAAWFARGEAIWFRPHLPPGEGYLRDPNFSNWILMSDEG